MYKLQDIVRHLQSLSVTNTLQEMLDNIDQELCKMVYNGEADKHLYREFHRVAEGCDLKIINAFLIYEMGYEIVLVS